MEPNPESKPDSGERDAGMPGPGPTKDGGNGPAPAEDAGPRDAATELNDAAVERDGGEFECPWQPYNEGLTGGRVAGVVVDPRASGRMYALSGAELFESQDNGATWEHRGRANSELKMLALDPLDSEIIYAATENGLLRSSDGGTTFSAFALSGLELTAVLVHPAEPRIIIASAPGAGLFRSTDKGVSWSTTGFGLPAMRVRALTAPPANENVILLGGDAVDSRGVTLPDGSGMLARSADGGLTWDVVLEERGRTYDIKFCPSDGDVVWAGTLRGIVRSQDSGEHWETVEFPNKAVTTVAAGGDQCRRVYAGVNTEGIHRSVDGGDTWTVAPLNSGIDVQEDRRAPLAMAMALGNPDTIVLGTHAAGFRTINGGDSWMRLARLGVLPIQQIMADRSNPGGAWLATFGAGLWFRSSPAASWERIPLDALPRDYVYSVAVHSTQPDVVAVGGSNEIFYSEDRLLNTTSVQTANAFQIDYLRSDPDIALAATHRRGVLRSSDQGQQWAASNTGIAPWDVGSTSAIDVRSVFELNSGTILIGTGGNGIFRSSDQGQTWSKAQGAASIETVGCFAEGPSAVFACSSDAGVLMSTDLGETWESLRANLPALTVNSLLFDSEKDTLYVGTPRGAFVSTDNGESFVPLDNGCIPGGRVGDLTLIQATGGERKLLASSTSRGVFAMPPY